MDNPEEVMQILERFNVARNPEITAQLEEYITFVARTGDSVYAWSLVKNLFREKLVNVITDFYNETPTKELPQYPNVDPFNYETMKKMLIEKLESFAAAPFTIQRISELLSDPRKQYSRIDKFMRAVEKTILVVSTVPPGRHRSESENGDSLDSALNGDFTSEVNVDIDMEQDGAFAVTKDTSVTVQRKEQNHEVKAANHETITIEKTVTEEEAGTSEKIEVKEADKASTAVKVESVPIAVIAPTKIEPASETPVIEKAEVSAVKSEASVIQETVTAVKVCEVVEPKVDDALLNEPIRSAENEILVDTAEVISETTPLAALENIVAIRTEPVVEAVEPVVQETAEPIAKTPTTTKDDSETEAKRLKIEEVSEVATEPPFVVQEVATAVVEVPVGVLIPELVEEPITEQVEAPVVIETSVIREQTATIPQAETVVEVIAPEKIDEPQPEIAEIPIETVPPTENISETPATEMETVSIITENTMSLDEDEPPALEQEMTPIANKMDTDDVEAAPMDFEDDAEPMDQ